jgi:hypothetical protein
MYHLQNVTGVITTKIKDVRPLLEIDEHKAYDLMFKMVHHSIGQLNAPEIDRNPLLSALTPDVKTLIININSLVRGRLAESSLHLQKTIEFIENAKRSKKPVYIILCDAFSLPEYLFTIFKFAESISVNNALCSINPSGKTATFKYLAQEYLKIKVSGTEQIIMRHVENALRLKLTASSRNRVFRDIDNLIHFHEFETLEELTTSLFKIMSKLHKEIANSLNQGYNVLIIADHGYDLMDNTDKIKLTHRWNKDKICISPFVPLLLIGK